MTFLSYSNVDVEFNTILELLNECYHTHSIWIDLAEILEKLGQITEDNCIICFLHGQSDATNFVQWMRLLKTLYDSHAEHSEMWNPVIWSAEKTRSKMKELMKEHEEDGRKVPLLVRLIQICLEFLIERMNESDPLREFIGIQSVEEMYNEEVISYIAGKYSQWSESDITLISEKMPNGFQFDGKFVEM